jgi:hypothetical protein
MYTTDIRAKLAYNEDRQGLTWPLVSRFGKLRGFEHRVKGGTVGDGYDLQKQKECLA